MIEWRLLVVEDDPDGQELLARMLRFHQIPFDVVVDGETAMDMLEQQSYSGALVDLALPGVDGWTLLDAIRNNPATADMPCVAMTAYHSADLAVKAVEAGFRAYFPKPLNSTSFVQDLARVLG
ncbi:MAG: response regulator [Anaerolineae bacterium]